MSPTSKELVANRPLTGSELSQIIQRDLASILSQDCMMTSHIAYGRCSYEILVTLHTDNFYMPSATVQLQSHPRSDNEIKADPALAAIEEPPPLADPSEDAAVHSIERHRDIPSPNLARLEHGLPVTVITHTADGHTQEEAVVYPAEVAAGEGLPPVDTDLSRQAKQAFSAAPRRRNKPTIPTPTEP